MGEKRTYHISDEERKARSERAKKARAEGKLGGSNIGQGRHKKPRASEELAEAAKDEAENMRRTLKDVMKNGSAGVKLNAVKTWIEIEQKEENIKIKEKQLAYSKASEEQLIKMIGARLKELKDAGIKIPDYIDVDAFEVEPKQIENGSE